MEIATTCKDVRTWQTLERELCAIGSATDRLHLRSNTTLLHCLEHDVDDVHVGINLLLHVVVLILEVNCNCALAILLVHLLYAILDEVLAVLETVAVVVADDI